MAETKNIEVRYGIHPEHGKALDTEGLRREFLISDLFKAGTLKLVYSHTDRIIVGGAVPVEEMRLAADKKIIGAEYLLERRELGVLNIGKPGEVLVDGTVYSLDRLDSLYVGKGSKDIRFRSKDGKNPAKFYFLSGMAHVQLPTRRVTIQDARKVPLGTIEESNKRTINQVLHPDVLPTCNLMMGITQLEPGSVWNTMPTHTHERRMEVYLYLDMENDAVVFHLMGRPGETRHLVVRNEEAVISPSCRSIQESALGITLSYGEWWERIRPLAIWMKYQWRPYGRRNRL
jgi:4-deoxy-L-threo-5-hexosulose-uronate ketol-isomerase